MGALRDQTEVNIREWAGRRKQKLAVTSREAAPYPPRPLKRRSGGAGREWGESDFPMVANGRRTDS